MAGGTGGGKPTKGRRVLVIDDNVHIHQDFQKILSAPPSEAGELDDLSTSLFGDSARPQDVGGFSVDVASQGEEGLEMVKDAVEDGIPYSLAFVDMRMPPGWNGVETVQQLWNVDPEIQIVICTAYSDFSWAEVIQTLGVTERLHLLRKPFEVSQVRKIAAVLASKWARLRRQSGPMNLDE